jgi:hypothetical protein
MKLEKIDISEIKKGDIYQHLPSGEYFLFERDDEIAWEVINSDNYSAWRVPKKASKKSNK